MKLHPVQERLIGLLENNIEEPLTMRELQEELGLSSPSVVFHHIGQLEKKGYLRRNPSNPKDYQVLSDNPEKEIAYLNLYGLAHCGPTGSVLDGDPVDRFPIASRLIGFSMEDAFMVKAKGDSMMPKIQDSDLVIAKKTNSANNGDIVVCVNNEEALIKKIQRSGDNTFLVSLNTIYEPFLAAEDFRVEGIVRGIFSNKI